MKKIITNGQVLIGDQLVKTDILFDEHQILAIGDHLEGADEIIDASGLHVLPGLIDTHVHLREPGFAHKETISTGSLAAAHGGFTTIFAMPNVKPYPSSREVMADYLKYIEEHAHVHVIPFGTITVNEAGKQMADYGGMKELGIRWFSDDGVGVADEALMEQCMQEAARQDVLFSCHTEDMAYRKPGASVHESEITKAKGWIGIPSACESAQLIRDLKLAEKTGVRYHADHISAKESVEALARAQRKGLDVTGEVTVHHLLLEDRDVQSSNWKMNPPLRSHEDRMALIQGLEEGVLHHIANDHAPHTEAEKALPMDKAPFGIVALETAFPLLYTEFVARQKRWSLPHLVSWMSKKPAERFGLKDRGEIALGKRPDFVLVDLNTTETIDKNTFESMGRNTPFDGWTVQARIKETIVDGQSVWKG